MAAVRLLRGKLPALANAVVSSCEQGSALLRLSGAGPCESSKFATACGAAALFGRAAWVAPGDSGLRCLSKAAKNKKDRKGGGATEANEDGGPPYNAMVAKEHMDKSLEHFQHELAHLRSGRATPGMFDHLKVQAYEQRMPLKSLATTSVRDPHTLVVTVFDPQTASDVEKAIADSPLRLNPRMEASDIVVPIPRPTSESIAALVKLAKAEAEAAKVAVRHARKVAMDEIKRVGSEDERKRAEKEVQKMTDQYIEEVERILKHKEKDFSML